MLITEVIMYCNEKSTTTTTTTTTTTHHKFSKTVDSR